MRYLLDSSALIPYGRGISVAVIAVRRLVEKGEELGVCAICVSEFYSGIPLGKDPEMDRLLQTLEYWPISYDDAVQAGAYRHGFARKGIQLSTQDTLIAAVARRVGATIVTENLKDFPMEDVVVASLSSL